MLSRFSPLVHRRHPLSRVPRSTYLSTINRYYRNNDPTSRSCEHLRWLQVATATATVVFASIGVATSSECRSASSELNSKEFVHTEKEEEVINPVCVPRRRTTQQMHLSSSVYSTIGKRAQMEDSHYISPDSRFAGVYDGHGGNDVSTFLRKWLHVELQKALAEQGNILGLIGHEGKDIEKALKTAFARSNLGVLKRPTWDYQGSTATCVYLDTQFVWTANVGDSRAVLSRRGKALPLTTDHKPTDKHEKERIEKLGGTIEWFGAQDNDGNPIDGHGVYRVNGNLSMTRAIGDKPERPYITSEPFVRSTRRDIAGDQFVLLASDGLWDVMSNENAVGFVHHALEEAIKAGGAQKNLEIIRNDVAKQLVYHATKLGSMDNVVVVIVWLQ